MFNVVAKQMLVMGIFMAIGVALYKTKLVSQEGSKTLTSLLIYLITPVTLFKSFSIARTPEKIKAFFAGFLLCALVQGLGLLFAHLIYRKKPLEEYAITYPNAGFFGIPVIQACLGSEAVFYISSLAVFVGCLQHSYGAYLLIGSKKTLNWKRCFLSPNAIGFYAGVFMFFTGLGPKIPNVVSSCVNQIANMSAFFAMTTLGIMLAQADLKLLYKNIEIYVVSLLRLVVIPLACALIFKFIPVSKSIKYAIILAWAGPIAANVANYSLLYNKDYSKASLYVCVSTVLCLGTLPLFAAFIDKLF